MCCCESCAAVVWRLCVLSKNVIFTSPQTPSCVHSLCLQLRSSDSDASIPQLNVFLSHQTDCITILGIYIYQSKSSNILSASPWESMYPKVLSLQHTAPIRDPSQSSFTVLLSKITLKQIFLQTLLMRSEIVFSWLGCSFTIRFAFGG